MNPTLYDVLGVSPDATADEIKRAWRDAADRFEPGAGGSGAQFHLFNRAAEVLLDPEKRAAYDASLTVADEPAAPTEQPEQPEQPAEPTEQPSEPTEQPAEPTEPAGPPAAASASRRGVPTVVLAALAVLALVAVGLAAWAGFGAQRAEARLEAFDRAPAAAERAAVAVLSYDHESLEADRDAAAKFLTDDYRDEYVKTFDSLVLENAAATNAQVEAEVLASSAMVQAGEGSPDRVPVLLFVNQTTVSTANEGPTTALNRVRLDMVEVGGTWLVDGITSY